MVKPRKWEYSKRIHNFQDGTVVEVLNKLGEDGWELVSIIWSGSGFYATMILKREKKASAK